MTYYTLVTSLPRHSRYFKVKQTPLSRTQLEKRLKLLNEIERTRLNDVINVVWHSWFSFTSPLSETIAQAKLLLALNDPFITNMINWFFDIRSLLVALRLRNIQKTLPADPKKYWSTDLSKSLIRNWQQQDFNMGRIYPWLTIVSSKLSHDEADEIEDILLTLIWKHLESIETGHYFDFAALILYLLRWNIVDYWSKFNESKALEYVEQRSEQIIAQGKFHE